jgi:tetratricopeptide (TPR) repeat protein
MSFILFFSQVALADDFDEAINRAKAALDNGKYADVTKELKNAKKNANKTERIIPRNEFVQLYFMEALSQFKQGKTDEAIPHLRKALISYPKLDFKNDVTSDPSHFELFLSVQSEVSYREKIDTYIPENYGIAEIYIDGALRSSGDKVRLGEHLAQIKCPKGEVFTKWTDFKGSFNWVKMCPYKFDLRKPCPVPNDDPLALNPFEEIPAHCVEGGENPLTKPDSVLTPDSKTPTENSQVWTKINKPLLIGSVLSAATAGTLYYLALQERKSFDNLGTGAITSEDELRSLQGDINTKVYISAGLGVATVGLYAGAFWKVRF